MKLLFLSILLIIPSLANAMDIGNMSCEKFMTQLQSADRWSFEEDVNQFLNESLKNFALKHGDKIPEENKMPEIDLRKPENRGMWMIIIASCMDDKNSHLLMKDGIEISLERMMQSSKSK